MDKEKYVENIEKYIGELPDVQKTKDDRNIPIDVVGITEMKYPISVAMKQAKLIDTGIKTHIDTIATIAAGVKLPATEKGTHMSRIASIVVENLSKSSDCKYIIDLLVRMVREMDERLHGHGAMITIMFDYFMPRRSPITRISYDKAYRIHITADKSGDDVGVSIGVFTEVMTLCPCSKEISDRGAHNQRAKVDLEIKLKDYRKKVWFEDLIDIIEKSGSQMLHTILKRPDEKYITETSYDNPKFVEDVARDIVIGVFENIKNVSGLRVAVQSQESIHPHDAFAMIEMTEYEYKLTKERR